VHRTGHHPIFLETGDFVGFLDSHSPDRTSGAMDRLSGALSAVQA
jgi:hypothetical protein